jgi:hypothetical protein
MSTGTSLRSALPETRAAWESRKPQLRKEILQSVGLEDIDRRGPVRWSSRGRIDREDYSIEKILYESYPGMMVPALVYVPKNLNGRAPAIVGISGHNYCEGKAVLHVQSRSVNLGAAWCHHHGVRLYRYFRAQHRRRSVRLETLRRRE